MLHNTLVKNNREKHNVFTVFDSFKLGFGVFMYKQAPDKFTSWNFFQIILLKVTKFISILQEIKKIKVFIKPNTKCFRSIYTNQGRSQGGWEAWPPVRNPAPQPPTEMALCTGSMETAILSAGQRPPPRSLRPPLVAPHFEKSGYALDTNYYRTKFMEYQT